MNVEDVYSALIGLGELALSGCTTAFDHHYVVPDGDDSVSMQLSMQKIGIRRHWQRFYGPR